MAADIGQIAAATVAALAPFLPYLIDAGRFSGEALAEMIVQKGGEAAWKKAQVLWGRVTARFGDDPEVQSAATMVAAKPEDETRQTLLAKVLSARLAGNPELAQEILALLGGEKGVQQVIADRSSWVDHPGHRAQRYQTYTTDQGVTRTLPKVIQFPTLGLPSARPTNVQTRGRIVTGPQTLH
jgi:hypothetical protein